MVVFSDGYTKLKNTEKGEEEAKVVKSQSLLGAATGFLKGDKSRYQQLGDADSDCDDIREEPKPVPPSATTSNATSKNNADKKIHDVDSSSENHDQEDEDYVEHLGPKPKTVKDFGYQELDDEFGSRRSKSISSEDFHSEDSVSIGKHKAVAAGVAEKFDEYDNKHPLHVNVHDTKVMKSVAKESPQDPVVGHALGNKALLEDDELSEAELNPANPFKSNQTSRVSSAMSASASSSALSGSALSSPTSPFTPTQEGAGDSYNSDIFQAAPFKRKSQKLRRKKDTPEPLTSPKGDTDPFANAPFRKTPTGSVAVIQGLSMLATSPNQDNNAFEEANSMSMYPSSVSSVQNISPSVVEMRSPSQSPLSQSQSSLKEVVPMQVVGQTPPISPNDEMDLFGSASFSSMDELQLRRALQVSENEKKVVQAQQKKQQMQLKLAQQQREWWEQQQQQHQAVSPLSPQSGSYPQTPSTPDQDLFGAVPFKEMTTQLLADSHSSSSSTKNPADRKNNSSKSHKGSSSSGGRKPSGSRRRRGSSDSRSSGSEGKSSPRSIKKDNKMRGDSVKGKYKTKSELLHDENIDVISAEAHYGSLKKNKTKFRKSPRDISESAFSNMSYEDYDLDMKCEDDFVGSITVMNQAFTETDPNVCENLSATTQDALKNTENLVGVSGGCHTLPRTKEKKHRVLPITPSAEPFTVKKKSGSIFK